MLVNLGRGMSPCNPATTIVNTPPPSLTDFDWLYFHADMTNAANAAAIYSYDFEPSDIDTGANTIDFGSDIGFNLPFSTTASNQGVYVQFTTTGTLDSALEEGKKYFCAKSSGTDYKIYDVATTSNRAQISNVAFNGSIHPSQGFILGELEVILTGDGTGTHTMSTGLIMPQFKDELNDYFHDTKFPDDKNGWMEVYVDGDGKEYINQDFRSTTPDKNGEVTSKGHRMGDTSTRVSMKTHLSAAETLMRSYVADFQYVNNTGESLRLVNTASGVNLSTGEITIISNENNYITGAKVEFLPNIGSTLPAGFSTSTVYYVRENSNSKFTVHPTKADAEANTNVIIPSNIGTGKFNTIFTQYVTGRNNIGYINEWKEADSDRESLKVGTNVGTGFQVGIFDLDGNSTPYKSTSSSFSGVWNGIDEADDYSEIFVFKPRDAVLICVDTGLNLETGIYYVGGGSGSTNRALYRNLSDAMDDGANNRNVNSVGAKCITYSAVGAIGQAKLVLKNGSKVGINLYVTPYGTTPFPQLKYNEKHHYMYVARYNDPAASFIEVDAWVDGVKVGTLVTAQAKRTTATTDGIDGNVGIFLNSTQPHASAVVLIYTDSYGATIAVLISDADLIAFDAIVRARHGIS